MERFTSNAYSYIEQVLKDIDMAASDIIQKLELPNGTARQQYISVSNNQHEISAKVTAFKERAHELVRREKAAAKMESANGINGTIKSPGSSSRGGSNASVQIVANPSENKTVLTLYGNAPGPKQLFSSLQIPTKIPGEQREVLQTIREVGLPNGISTTQIIPMQSISGVDDADKKRVPTLGELFPTPANIPSLVPPKPSKVATTRSSNVGWYQPSTADTFPRTAATYNKQSISSGQWLDYSNASSSSQGSKRKQRDRALSLGGTKALDTEPAETDAAKLEALFRGAYSSFAPSKDDAAAIASTGTMDRMWWQQVGETSFQKFIENGSRFETTMSPDLIMEEAEEEVDEMKAFEEAVEKMEKDAIDPTLILLEDEAVVSAEDKDVDEILQTVSELLETLNSFQRIRHLSLNSSNRPAGLLSAPDTSSQGTPTKPSESEQATYEILKSQLSLMISSLPPYAVAKLDPSRLADLSISTKIEVELNSYKGVMEEDEAGTRARLSSMGASSAVRTPSAPVQQHRSNPAALYGNQYAPSQPRPTSTQQYYPAGGQTPIRPPSANIQRPPATISAPYQAQRPAAATPYRPTTYGTPTYQNHTPRPVQQPYTSSSHQQQYLQTPGQSYMRPTAQTYQVPQSAPHGAANGRYTGQPAYPHQSQSSQNSLDYRYGNGAGISRQATSPQKPVYSPQPSSAQPRPAYSASTPALPQDRRAYAQNPLNPTSLTNGSTQQAYPAQSTGLTNYSTFMSEEQQESMLRKQQGILAAQQAGTQQSARSAAQAAMASSSNTQVNGGNAVAAGVN